MRGLGMKNRNNKQLLKQTGPFFLFCFFIQLVLLAGITYAQTTTNEECPTTPAEAFCRSCHGTTGACGETADRHHTIEAVGQPGVYLPCFDCHGSVWDPNAMEFVLRAERDCTVCHGDFTDHIEHSHPNVMYDPATDLSQEAPGTPCAVCHNDNGGNLSTWPDIRFEHEVPTNGVGACSTCHLSDRPDVIDAIQNGRNGIVQNCLDCHGDKETPCNPWICSP